MRHIYGDPGASDYMCTEALLNEIDRIFQTKTNALAVALIDAAGNPVSPSGVASSCGDGTQTVTTAGTRVKLSATSVPCKRVFVQAHESNTGTIVVGGSTVVGALVGRRGLALFPSQGDWFNVSDISLLYIDATLDAQKVNFYYEV